MPDSPSISRSRSTLPLSDASTPSSPASGGRKPADGNAHASQQADANLSQLVANNSSEASGKRKGTSFSAKPPVTQQGAGGMPGGMPGQPGRPGRFGGLAQGAATVANDASGLASAGMNVLGSVMQFEQAAVNQIAELIKQGAHNVEEASKG
ncbi:hypothetical protein [Paraburkholderia haematera]|jgi:hypothetical protein|uniref:Uncharacterized protein n=1 Tax=Paraburkholderia haematera TaxID=2793077 RepID=A0ABN7L8Q2_9BURK|nr:hypothetical protein [Paraburkholderia haematera]CAE6731252.1 hypothetical protein R69888_02071 [Paraburkholderia haematera]